MRRLADRKFVFDWDTGEDTSTDFNPMYGSGREISSDSSCFSLQLQESTSGSVLWTRPLGRH